MSKIIVALDDINPERNIEVAQKLKGKVEGFKVNHLMWEHTNLLKNLAEELFIDCKLWDTPNTIKQVMQRIIDKGATMTTVSTLNSSSVFHELLDLNHKIKMLGVTYLTSWQSQELLQITNQSAPVLWRENIDKIRPYGFAGLICSAMDLQTVKPLSDEMIKVCPGIGQNKGQVRTVTPKQAVKLGADYLVVGRAITNSDNPVNTVEEIKDSIG